MSRCAWVILNELQIPSTKGDVCGEALNIVYSKIENLVQCYPDDNCSRWCRDQLSEMTNGSVDDLIRCRDYLNGFVDNNNFDHNAIVLLKTNEFDENKYKAKCDIMSLIRNDHPLVTC